MFWFGLELRIYLAWFCSVGQSEAGFGLELMVYRVWRCPVMRGLFRFNMVSDFRRINARLIKVFLSMVKSITVC